MPDGSHHADLAAAILPPTAEALADLTATELGHVIANHAASDDANDIAYDAYCALSASTPRSPSDAAAMLLSISHDMSDLLDNVDAMGAELPSYLALGRVIEFLCEIAGFTVSELGGDYFTHTAGQPLHSRLSAKYWCERVLGDSGTLLLLEDGSVDFMVRDPDEAAALRSELASLDANVLVSEVSLIAAHQPPNLENRVRRSDLPGRRWAITSHGANWRNTLVQLSGPSRAEGVAA